MDEERSADAEEFEEPRDDEQLQEEPGQADVAEVAAVALADELLPRRRALRTRSVQRFGGADDVAAEQVLA